ncbi:MAG: hypothetical protein WC307_06435 [Candidatus Nanoarchaeia archaeon]
MSRNYELNVKVKGLSLEQIRSVVVDKFRWEEIDNDDMGGYWLLMVSGCLCGGMGEEQAYNQIADELKKLNPDAKIGIDFIYLDEPPCESFGDDFEDEGDSDDE